MALIDFHCHLDLYPNPHDVVVRCREFGGYVLSVTTTPSAFEGTREIALHAPRVRTALGLHPALVVSRRQELEIFDRHLPNVRFVGEVGLDGSREHQESLDQQREAFNHILISCRQQGGRVISIHSRGAASAVLNAIEKEPGCGIPILHWFSGSIRELARASEIGCWFSVGPAMLRSKKGRTLASQMPRNRVLTESDGPFAQVDGRAAGPWDINRAISYLSQVWSLPPMDVEKNVANNLRKLVSLSTAENQRTRI